MQKGKPNTMKKLTLSIFPLLIVAFASQSSHGRAPHFQHVIVMIQENRTPDNLFCSCHIPGADTKCSAKGAPISLTGYPDPGHGHWNFLREAAGNYQAGEYDYVRDSVLAPYCELGRTYGFANRMFQTNQGPSGPAHDFILAASSQPSPGSDLFLSENTDALGGCPLSTFGIFINPEGQESRGGPACLTIDSLPTLLSAAGLSWRYYTPSQRTYWNAPQAMARLCRAAHGECGAPDWAKNDPTNPAQVLSDIANGKLATVSWVVPGKGNSDHPGSLYAGGPAWISSVVNAVGNSPYWENTAIFVTWDDWGGWYDHVPPLPNNSGFCEQYCYGFRVPLLVISAYTPAMIDDDPHNFGSIANFIEENFKLGSLGAADAYSDNLDDFFPASEAKRAFISIDPRGSFDPEDRTDPDDY
jgi:phospholipase C